MFGRIHARGRESGLELDSPTGWVFTLRGGKIVKAEGFLSRPRPFTLLDSASSRSDAQGAAPVVYFVSLVISRAAFLASRPM
jgi:hypothetical protein